MPIGKKAAASQPVTRPVIPFSPLRTQQFPGGSEILDQNLDRIKKTLDSMSETVNSITTAIKINVDGTVAPVGGGTTISWIDSSYSDSSGVETWRAERMVDFTVSASPSAILVVTADGQESSGFGQLFVRIGGTPRTPDGLLVATLTTLVTAFAGPQVLRTTFPNPGVAGLLKLSGKSSASGQTNTWRSIVVRL